MTEAQGDIVIDLLTVVALVACLGFGAYLFRLFVLFKNQRGLWLALCALGLPAVAAAQEFDGVDDYAEYVYSVPIDMGQPLSISLWVKPTAFTGEDFPFAFHGNLLDSRLYLSGQSAAWAWEFNNGTESIGEASGLPINAWTHVAITIDAARGVEVYKNGVSVASGTFSAGSLPSTLYVLLAKGLYGSHYGGGIYDVRVWDIDLTGQQMLDAFNGLDVLPSSLIHWWPLDDGSGTTLVDYGLNSNNLTLYNITESSFWNGTYTQPGSGGGVPPYGQGPVTPSCSDQGCGYGVSWWEVIPAAGGREWEVHTTCAGILNHGNACIGPLDLPPALDPGGPSVDGWNVGDLWCSPCELGGEGGIPDGCDDCGDLDGDCIPNMTDTDDDGDGCPDEVNGIAYDTTPRGGGCGPIPDPCDTDGDYDGDCIRNGHPDETDDDDDGIPDSIDVTPRGTCSVAPEDCDPAGDYDGDGIANSFDDDADGDGCLEFHTGAQPFDSCLGVCQDMTDAACCEYRSTLVLCPTNDADGDGVADPDDPCPCDPTDTCLSDPCYCVWDCVELLDIELVECNCPDDEFACDTVDGPDDDGDGEPDSQLPKYPPEDWPDCDFDGDGCLNKHDDEPCNSEVGCSGACEFDWDDHIDYLRERFHRWLFGDETVDGGFGDQMEFEATNYETAIEWNLPGGQPLVMPVSLDLDPQSGPYAHALNTLRTSVRTFSIMWLAYFFMWRVIKTLGTF